MDGLTYKKAGVDIDEGDRFINLISPLAKKTFRPEVITDIGSFNALFQPDIKKYKQPVLVSGTDGVGTKLKIAFMMDKHDTVGIDLVAMDAVGGDKMGDQDPVFIGGPLRVGQKAPVSYELLSLIDPQYNIAIADIDS